MKRNNMETLEVETTVSSEVIAFNAHREALKEDLGQGVCEVTFTKINGDERIMTCTLDESIIPVEHHPKGGERHSISLKNIAVWDIKAEGWRSFRPENVTKFKVLEF